MRWLANFLRLTLHHLWEGRHVVPITPLGAGFALLGAWLSRGPAAAQIDYVLLAAGIVAIGVVGLALVLVLLASLRIWLAVRGMTYGADLVLESGQSAGTELRFPTLRRWPLVGLRIHWEHPAQVEVTLAQRLHYTEELIRPSLRSESSPIRRRFVIEDILGFARLGLRARSPQCLRVLPSCARVTAHLITRYAGGDTLSYPTGPVEGEPLEMRRYVHGDPLRYILWKAFARTRKLLVRAPEQAITPRPSAAAYFVAGPGDEPTASAARFFIEAGLLGRDFHFAADGAAAPTAEPASAIDQIVASVRQRTRGAEGLAAFLGRLSTQQLQSVILFVPPEPGPWVARVEEAARQLRGRRVITAIDEAPAEDRRSPLHRFLFIESGTRTRSQHELARVVHRLSNCGYDVQVLHRPSGELLGHAQLALLARLGA